MVCKRVTKRPSGMKATMIPVVMVKLVLMSSSEMAPIVNTVKPIRKANLHMLEMKLLSSGGRKLFSSISVELAKFAIYPKTVWFPVLIQIP